MNWFRSFLFWDGEIFIPNDFIVIIINFDSFLLTFIPYSPDPRRNVQERMFG